jgi:hypothetical protein
VSERRNSPGIEPRYAEEVVMMRNTKLALSLAVAALLAAGCADDDDRDSAAVMDTATAVAPAAPDAGLPGGDAPGREPGDTPGGDPRDTVSVFFTRDEAPVEVRRVVAGGGTLADSLRATLEALLAGPTAAERAQGISSWFSDATAGMLRSVEIDGTRAVIDFHDLRPVIPNASTSLGSRLLTQELNRTVFQFEQIRAIDYRINGDCAAFWEWLQFDCQTVRVAAAGSAGTGVAGQDDRAQPRQPRRTG